MGTPPPSMTQASVTPPPLSQPRGGGLHTRLRVRGWGSPNSDDSRESFVLSAEIVKQSMRARKRLGIGLSYTGPQAKQAGGVGSFESILGLLKSLKIRAHSVDPTPHYICRGLTNLARSSLRRLFLPSSSSAWMSSLFIPTTRLFLNRSNHPFKGIVSWGSCNYDFFIYRHILQRRAKEYKKSPGRQSNMNLNFYIFKEIWK